MTTIGDRLKQIRGNTSQKDFAEQFDVSINTVGYYERMQRSPDLAFLQKLKSAGYSIDWIISGDEKREYSENNHDCVYIPLYNAKLAAGHGSIINDQNIKIHIPFTPELINNYLCLNVGNLALFEVEGDSMADKIEAGHIVMVDTAQNEIRDSGIYAFSLDDSLLVKYLQRIPNGEINVSSHNSSAYPSYNISPKNYLNEQFKIIGKVVWHSGKP